MPRKGKTRRNSALRNYVPRVLANTPHRFTRTCAAQFGVNSFQGFTSASGATIYGNGVGFDYSLSQVTISGNLNSFTVAIPNYAEFTSLFDQYRIVGVKERWVWTNNVTNASSAVGSLVGTCNPVVLTDSDRNDSAPPTSSTELMERDSTKYLSFDSNGPKKLFLRPNVDIPIGVGGTGAAIAAQGSPWISTAAVTAKYYGRKNWMMSASSAGTQLQTGYIWVFFTLEFEFRTPI